MDEEDEEEEEKKEVNVELNKETYKDHFPTLSQTSKTQTQGPFTYQLTKPKNGNDAALWPGLPLGKQKPNGESRPFTAQQSNMKQTQQPKAKAKKVEQIQPLVKDRAFRQLERQNANQERALNKRIESMVEQEADSRFEYREEQDYLDIGNIQQVG